MTIRMMPVSELIPADYNPRKTVRPGSALFKQIEASIDRFGFVQPIVWNQRSGRVVGGHQRLAVLVHRGVTEVEASVVDLDDDDEKALNIALNRVGEDNWHKEKLADLLNDLGSRRSLDDLGFTKRDLSSILKPKVKTPPRDPDAEVRLAESKNVRAGDIVGLTGPDGTAHRFMCGDPVRSEHVRGLVGTAAPVLVWIDALPLTVVSEGGKRAPAAVEPVALAEALTAILTNAATVCADNAALYVFAPERRPIIEAAVTEGGWHFIRELVWKRSLTVSRAHYHSAHEAMIYAGRTTSPPWRPPTGMSSVHDTAENLAKLDKKALISLLVGLRDASTVWEASREREALFSRQRPVALAGRAIANHVGAGQFVLDVGAGVGTTMVAAEMAGVPSLSMDYRPGMVEAAVRRFVATFETVALTINGKDFTLADWK